MDSQVSEQRAVECTGEIFTRVRGRRENKTERVQLATKVDTGQRR